MALKVNLRLNKKVYVLQHPGNREWVRLYSKLYNVGTQSLNLEELFDYCFEHVVFPHDGPKLSLETVDIKELEDWGALLPSFLRGELDPTYSWSDVDGGGPAKGKGKTADQKGTETKSKK